MRPIIQRDKPWRSEDHLKKVRSFPCSRCGNPFDTNAHHLIGVVSRGAGQKVSDALTMPLCPTCHNWIHANSDQWEQQWAWLVMAQSMILDMGPAETWEVVARCLAERIESGAGKESH